VAGVEELLCKKLKWINIINGLTESIDLNDEDFNAKYIDLVNERESLIKKIKSIDSEIFALGISGGLTEVSDEIKASIERILTLEERFKEILPKKMDELREGIKQAKKSRIVSQAYGGGMLEGLGGWYDMKN
jgi:hypothetical protein